MKKIKFLSLMLVALMLFFAVGCGGNKTPEDLVKAKDYVNGLYKDDAAATPDNYELVSKVVSNGVTYKVEWTVEIAEGKEDDVQLSKNADGKTVVTVNKYTETLVKYTLTFTVEDAKGNKLSHSYEKNIPAFKMNTWEEYATSEKETLLNVQGVVTGIMSKSKGNSYNCLYFQDSVGGYYAYGMASDPVTDGIKVGMTVMVTGKKDVYSGTLELKDATAVIVDSEIKEVEAVDYTQKFESAKDLKDTDLTEKQALLVTIKNVDLGDMNESNGYLYFKLSGKESYVRISSSVCPIAKDEQTALKAKQVKGQKANVTGVICVYDGAFYLTPVSVDAIEHVKEDLTDAQKVERATEKVNELKDQVYAKDLDLFTAIAGIDGLAIAWTSANTELITNDGKLVKYPLEETAVKLTAVITAGSEKATVEIEVKVAALSRISVAEALLLCDSSEKPMIFVEGKLIGLDVDGFGFVADETGVIYVRTKFEGFKVGDTVKVIGTATVYANKQYTRQVADATITATETVVKELTPIIVTFEDLAKCENNDDVINNRLYGKLVTITGYVSVRGNYKNAYIASANDAESYAVGCWYKGTDQDGIKALEGKLVTFTAPVYNYSFSDNAWLLGSYTNLVEGEVKLEKTEGAITLQEVLAAEVNTMVTFDAQVKFVNPGTGVIVTDGTDDIFLYTKNDVSGLRVGDHVSVAGKRAAYNNAPQIGNPVITIKSTGKYEYTAESKTLAEVNALDPKDIKNFGKVFKVTGTPVAADNFVNFEADGVTYSFYLSKADKEILRGYAGKKIEICVLTYNYNSKTNLYNFFAITSTITEVK